MSGLKEQILQSMEFRDYKRYFEQEIQGEIGKLNSSGWAVCLCPFHDDTNPSLNINFFQEGAWRCHACSETGDLFTFHQKKHGTDFKGALEYFANFMGIDPDNVESKKKAAPKKKKSLGPPAAVYQYRNLNGKVIYETCKYENPKDFRQRRPHPTKEGEFVWNLKDIEVVPYNLQTVVKSDTLYIVEGEKDADRLAQIGLTATCNPMGAGKWWNSLTPYFKDKTVIILPDNDDPGRKHADLVAMKLHGTAKAIQIINLPNLKEGGDVSDWLGAGNTKADLIELIEKQKPYEDHIDFLNKNHAVVMLGGKCFILNESIDPIFDRPTISFSSVGDFRVRYSNRLIPNPNGHIKGQPKQIGIVTDWMKSPDRRQYDDIIFSPGKNMNGCYNLWRGFAFEPKKGDWSRLKEHVFKIICKEKQDINDWVLTWMAKIVQDPGGERAKTSIVLRGDQGVGKGVFLSSFGKIFGNHYMQINNQKQLTSRFNQHLRDVIFLFVDEGFWAGDKAGEGVIKGIVTEDLISIEGKGKDVITLHNHIRMAMASNSEWIVPMGTADRRFCVLDVCDSMRQNKKYFNAIFNELAEGGYAAMLYDLLEYDTSKVDVTRILLTAAGFDQKVESMTPVGKFWFEKLRSGDLHGEDLSWGEAIKTRSLYEQYRLFCEDIGVRHRKIDKQFGKELKQLCPGITRKLIKTSDSGAENYVNKWHYCFAGLENCRDSFEKAINTELDWDNDLVYVRGEFDGI